MAERMSRGGSVQEGRARSTDSPSIQQWDVCNEPAMVSVTQSFFAQGKMERTMVKAWTDACGQREGSISTAKLARPSHTGIVVTGREEKSLRDGTAIPRIRGPGQGVLALNNWRAVMTGRLGSVVEA